MHPTSSLTSVSFIIGVFAIMLGGYLSVSPVSHKFAISLLSPTPRQTFDTADTPYNTTQMSGLDPTIGTTSNKRNNISDFEAWLKEQGVSFRRTKLVTSGESGTYRGLHSKRKGVKKGSVVLDLPDQVIITTKMAAESAIGRQIKAALPKDYTDETGNLFLALFLLEQRSLGTKSYWYHYIESLPKSYPTIPVTFTSEKDLNVLKESGSNFFDEFHTKPVHQLQADYKSICTALLLGDPTTSTSNTNNDFCIRHSFLDYQWARLTVQSRTFSLDIDGSPIAAMIPYADTLNHDNKPNLLWSYNDTTRSVQFTALEDVHGDAAFSTSYGLLGSRYTLDHYGFAIRDTAVETALVSLSIPGGDDSLKYYRALKATGSAAAAAAGLERVDFHVGSKPDDSEFLNALGLHGSVSRGVWWRALGFLGEAVDRALRGLLHSVEADELFLLERNSGGSDLSVNARNMVITRLGEKRVLMALREVVGRMRIALLVPPAGLFVATVGFLEISR
ncbi:hypothetical protein BDR26DRAFT_983576 [Obelidium mucronatum]|nr:hypothetical protein BDR26DRAFT_983576 [Obelidium mucronatum]